MCCALHWPSAPPFHSPRSAHGLRSCHLDPHKALLMPAADSRLLGGSAWVSNLHSAFLLATGEALSPFSPHLQSPRRSPASSQGAGTLCPWLCSRVKPRVCVYRERSPVVAQPALVMRSDSSDRHGANPSSLDHAGASGLVPHAVSLGKMGPLHVACACVSILLFVHVHVMCVCACVHPCPHLYVMSCPCL